MSLWQSKCTPSALAKVSSTWRTHVFMMANKRGSCCHHRLAGFSHTMYLHSLRQIISAVRGQKDECEPARERSTSAATAWQETHPMPPLKHWTAALSYPPHLRLVFRKTDAPLKARTARTYICGHIRGRREGTSWTDIRSTWPKSGDNPSLTIALTSPVKHLAPVPFFFCTSIY